MQALDYPTAFGHWHLRRDRLVCHLPQKTVSITAPGSLLRAVLELCNGRMAWHDVAQNLTQHWSADSVHAFLSNLSREGVLVEANEVLASWAKTAQLAPQLSGTAMEEAAQELRRLSLARLRSGQGAWGAVLPAEASAMASLLRARESHQTFSNAAISVDSLAVILWAAHGVTRRSPAGDSQWHRTIESGVSAHCARWFVLVLRPLPANDGSSEGLAPGLYECQFHVEGGASFERAAVTHGTEAWRLLPDPRPLNFEIGRAHV